MTLSMNDLEHVLKLAHLTISEAEKQEFLPQLQSVLDDVETLNKYKVDQQEPSASSLNQATLMREDKVSQQILNISKNAPDWEEDCISVPKILG